MYDGIFGNAYVNAPKSIPVFCPGVNCTWDYLTSIGVCGFCANVTNDLTSFDNFSALCWENTLEYNTNICGPLVQNQAVPWLQDPPLYQLYTTLNANQSFAFQNLPSYILSFFVLENEQAPGPLAALFPSNAGRETWATECALQYCVQTYNVSSINGELKRTLTNLSQTLIPGMPGGSLQDPTLRGILPNISDVLQDTLQGNITGDNLSSGPVVDQFYAIHDVAVMVVNITTAISVWFSSGQISPVDAVNGTVWINETQVRVAWPWLTLPILLVAGSTAFLIIAILQGRRQAAKLRHVDIWKNNALALLYHGLDKATLETLPPGHKTEEMSVAAKATAVQLIEGANWRSLFQGRSREETKA